MHRVDGGVVDAEIIRPLAWIESNGIEAGKLLPMHIEELQVRGSVVVTAIEPCPEIAEGEGSVVTARFLTREVHEIARVEILGPGGELETVEGTTIHPIWSEDRQDWVPLGELQPGETLRAASGAATVLSVQILNQAVPVYNIEVHGEHVYQVGQLGLLVHNSGDDCARIFSELLSRKAITQPGLPPGVRAALVIDGKVYAARFHNVAWNLAGQKGNISFYGFAELDEFGNVIRLLLD